MAKRITEEDLRLNYIVNGDKAQKELIELEMATAKLGHTNKELRAEKARLISEGKKESAEYKKLNEEIKANNLAMDKNKARMEVLRNEIGVTGMSFNQLSKRARDLKAQINSMTPNNPMRAKLKAELAEINAQMNRLGVGAQRNKLSLGGMADGFNKYFGMIGAFAASFTGVVLGFRKLVDVANQFEERVDNLSALTGLEGENLEWLAETAKQTSISTVEGNIRIKQSADAIVDAYTKVGSKRPELLKNKEALHAVTQDAIILSEAAKSELQPAVDGLTMAMNQLGYGADESRRIINTMAAGSKEGAADIPYLTEAFEKSGTTARLLGLDIETLTGTIEAVAPSYSRAEMAGNSLDKVMLKMKANNIGYVDGQFNMVAAVDELKNRFAQGETAVDMFGVEHAKMAEILVLNRDEIVRYTNAVTGTQIALEQAAKNTDNNAAKLAQAKNKFQLVSIELGTKLAPAMTFSTNSFSYLMKAMMAGIDIWKNYSGYIKTGALAIAAYTIAVNASVVSDKIKVFWNEKVLTSFNSIKKLNPAQIYGLIASGVILAVGALITYFNNQEKVVSSTEKYKKSIDDLNGKIAEEKGQMISLFEQLKKTNEGTAERKEMVDKINDQYGKYLPNLLTEKSTLDQITAAQLQATNALENHLVALAKNEELTKIIVAGQKEQGQIIGKQLAGSQSAEQIRIFRALADNLASVEKGSAQYLSQIEAARQTVVSMGGSTDALVNMAESLRTQKQLISEVDDVYGALEVSVSSTTNVIAENEEIKNKLTEKQLKNIETEKGKYDELLKAYKDLQFEISNASESADVAELNRINRKYDEMVVASKGNQAEIAVIERMRLMERERLAAQILESDKVAEENRKKALLEKSKQITDLLMSEEESRVKEAQEYWEGFIKWAEENGMAEEAEAMRSKMQKAIADIRAEFEKPATKDIFGMSVEDWDAMFARLDQMMEAAGSLMTMWSSYNAYRAVQDQNEVNRIEKDNQRKLDSQKEYLDLGFISEEAYAASVAQLETELDQKKAVIAYNAAKRDKQIKLAQVAIDTAAAVMKIWAEVPKVDFGISTGILTAAAIATGAFQAAAIMATPLPELAQGNIMEVMGQSGTKYNASRGSGTGLFSKPTVHNGNKIVGEKQPELVFSGPDTKKILNSPELMQAINYTIRLPEYAAGNYTASSTGNSTALEQSIMRLNDILESGIVAKLLANDEYINRHNTAVTKYNKISKNTSF
jgi:TP901 family phage tail tape measure protein